MKTLRASFFCLLTYLFVTQEAFSASGSLFEVISSGTSANVKIQACLNVRGSNSCEVFDITGLNISIKSTIPGRNYPNAGIKVISDGFAIDGCSQTVNGYCIFAMNNQTPRQVLLNNLRNTQRFIYVANYSGGSITRCIGNFPSGTVENCGDAGISINSPFPLAAHPSGNFLYMGRYANPGGVSACSVAANGGLSCGSFTITPNFVSGIAIHPDATKIYISSGFSEVLYCDLNDLSITDCQTTGSGFSASFGIVINSAGTHVYVTNRADDSISTCEVAEDKSLTCGAKIYPTGLDQPSAIGIDPSGEYLYVSSLSDRLVKKCLILADDSIGEYSDAASSIRSYAMTFASNFAFFSISSGSLSVCSILVDNNLLCGDSGQTGFSLPLGVAVI